MGPDRQGSAYWFAEAAKRAKRKFGSDQAYSEKPGWLNVAMIGERKAEIRIYGQITEFPWIDDEVSASQIYNDLQSIEADEIHVRINSPGGSVFEGMAIYSLLSESDAKVIGHIDGVAASAATFPALACDELSMCEGGQFMVHKPYTLEVGNADEMRKTADVLDKIEAGMVALYQRETKATKAEIRTMISEETWLTAQEAVELGFADSIAGVENEEPAEEKESLEVSAEKISEPVKAQNDLDSGEVPEDKTIALKAKARRLQLYECQLIND
tara:strand:+ start:1813 stop:2625 length:813 start_codon:yes stop_codon:yes gene_type:complete